MKTKDKKFMDRVIKNNPEWVHAFNSLNKQETKELEYFQKIQVLKQEISALKIDLGKANAEIQHLNHALKERVTAEYLSRYASKVNRKNAVVKCAKLMNELVILKGEELPQPPQSPESPRP